MTDRNEALRLAEFAEQISNEGPMIHTMSWSQLCGTFQMLADLARQQAERIAELEKMQDESSDVEASLRTRVAELTAERDQLRAEVERLRKPTNPLEDSVVMDEFCRTPGIHQFVTAFKAGVRFAERAHMIGSTNANQA